MNSIGKLVVVGVGLIGGSFALALKAAGRVGEVVGVGRSFANLEHALALGVIDRAEQDVAKAVVGADMVLVATPVGQMGATFAAMAPHLSPQTIVTDAGSTKSDVAALMTQYLPDHLAYCVPAHPIAGSEQSGAAAASATLYQGRKVVLAPFAQSIPEAIALVRSLWACCGACVEQMRAEEHDAIFAAVSHLPHLLAFSYIDMIAQHPDASRRFDFAATGFRDFTRIAGSHPEMWRDISLSNRDALLEELAAYQTSLQHLESLLRAEDGEGLSDLFVRARQARQAWYTKFQALA